MGESTDGIVLKHLRTLYSVGAIGGLSDGQLWDHVLAGRGDAAEAAFTILAERHGPMVLRICRQMLGDRHEAEDAFQATFLVLASKAHSIRNRDSVASWLQGVARRVALRAKADAARRRFKERRGAIPAEANSPADDGENGESWSELHEEISRLPERYREPIVLCYLQGLTTEAVSQRLGCPQGTVLSRLSRARERLRRGLTRRGLTLPVGLLALELCPDVAMAVPATLLDATVRASLGFGARQGAGATVASATAVGLARGAIYAMSISQWKTFGAAILACGLAMGSLRAFAQYAGPGASEKAPAAEPVEEDRQAALSRSVAKIRAELDEANRRNAELRNELQAIQAELKALRSGPTPTPTPPTIKEADRAVPKSGRGFGGMGGVARPVQGGDANDYRYHRGDQWVLMAAPLGGKVKIYDVATNKVQSLQLSTSKDQPLYVTAFTGPGAVALILKGSNITRLAAARSGEGRWYTQELREPVNGVVMPIVGPGIVVYHLGRYLYAFSPETREWDVVEMAKDAKMKREPTVSPGVATVEAGGHLYTFDAKFGKWNDLDARALFDSPENNEPDEAEPDRPRSEPTSRPTPP